MLVVECDLPLHSTLDRILVEGAYFRDSYLAPISRQQASLPDIFFSLFGHHPAWIKAALLTRNCVASWCGLNVPSAADILNPPIKQCYQVGDTIGPWPIFALTDTELIAGRDNHHLDFRLSLLRETKNGVPSVVVSTICNVHNLSGRIYLFFIVPFHKWGVKRLIVSAVKSGRL